MYRKWINNLLLIVVILVVAGVAKGDIVNELDTTASATPQPVGCVGCKCDGVADDTAAMNNALLRAANNTLQLPAGICMVGKLTPSSNTIVQGMGRGATILKLNADIGTGGTATGMFQLELSQTNVMFRKMTLDGNRTTYPNTSNDGILAPITQLTGTGITNLVVDDVEIKSFGGAGMMVLGPDITNNPATRHSRITVRNSRITDTGYVAFTTQGYVNYVVFDNNYVDTWGRLYGDSSAVTCGRYGSVCRITNNTIISPNDLTGQDICVSLDQGYDMVVSHNVIAGCIGQGVEVGFCTNVVVANNTLNDISRFGIGWDNGTAPQNISDASTVNGSGLITSASGRFFPALIDRTVTVTGCGPGGSTLVSVVKSVTPTVISLRDQCNATQASGVTVTWPITSNDVTIANNVLHNADIAGAQAAIGSNNVSVPAAQPYTTADFTCTSGLVAISSPTIVFRPWMNGRGITLTGCGPAGATLTTTIVATTSQTTATIANAASTSVAGTSTGSIDSNFNKSSNITVANNVITFSGGLGVFAASTDGVDIVGNIINGAALSGIFTSSANHVELGSNVVSYANNTVTAGHAGIWINLVTNVGTAFNMTGPNSAFGNGNGSGGIQDQLYAVDGAQSTLPNFPGVVAGGMVPNRNKATFGIVNNAFSVVNGCKGDVTLSGGAGTFTDPCVTTSSACVSTDITAPANACRPNAPTAGSVVLAGTATDVCRTVCQ